MNVHRGIWKRAPIEGEVEYNWQVQRENADPEGTFGRTPDMTMKVPAYRRYMIDKIRRYHTSYLGWIDNYDDSDPEVLAGAGELQKAFGYRFVIDSVRYPLTARPGESLAVKLMVRNTGSAPFYLDWPVGVALLDPETKKRPSGPHRWAGWTSANGSPARTGTAGPSPTASPPLPMTRKAAPPCRRISRRDDTSLPLPSSIVRAVCCRARDLRSRTTSAVAGILSDPSGSVKSRSGWP
jgi:hypothetical protein